MKESEFSEQLKSNGWKDEFWVAVDGAVLDGRLKLREAIEVKKQMPSRQVSLMHPQSVETEGVEWKPLDLGGGMKSLKRSASTNVISAKEVGDSRNQIRMINEDLRSVKTTYTELSDAMVEGFADMAKRFDNYNEHIDNLADKVGRLEALFQEMIDLRKLKQQLDERTKHVKQQELRKEVSSELQSKPKIEAPKKEKPRMALGKSESPKPLPPGIQLPGRVVGAKRQESEPSPPEPPPGKTSSLSTPPPPPPRRPQRQNS